jgi:hypothetical protein
MAILEILSGVVMAANVDLNKMKKLLAHDVPQINIAQVLGCSEGFISQCVASPEFMAEVAAIRIARTEAAANRDEAYDELEDMLLEKLKKSINFMLRPAEILTALEKINKAVRRGQTSGVISSNTLNQSVQIVLPNVTAVAFLKNQQGEIIEAGGRSLATLSSTSLKQMASTNQKLLGVTHAIKDEQTKVRELENLAVI